MAKVTHTVWRSISMVLEPYPYIRICVIFTASLRDLGPIFSQNGCRLERRAHDRDVTRFSRIGTFIRNHY